MSTLVSGTGYDRQGGYSPSDDAQQQLSDYRCWALSTGEAGMVSQVLGLAEAVGFPFELKTVSLRWPWRWLPGHRCPGALRGLAAHSDPLGPPWPDLVITCGRRSVPLALAIKRSSGGGTRTVHIQNPLVPVRYFDLVVPMRHDRLTGPGVLPTQVALHRVTSERLQAAADRFKTRFARSGRPLVAVLIGGTCGSYVLTPGHMDRLCGQLRTLVVEQGVALVVSPSRRTGPANESILRQRLADLPVQIWDGRGENPYYGMLALADHLVVTCDSVSMVSEACATGKPVYVVELSGGNKRLGQFHQQLQQAGVTRPFTGELSQWTYPPMNETAAIAETVRGLFAASGRVA